jgi:hypothetical protein
MPAGKRQQGDTMLYTLIAFVGLFLLATAGAVIFYVQAAEHRKNVDDLDRQVKDLATSSERSKIGSIVGTKQSGQSYLGTMVDNFDKMVTLIVGGVPEPTSAEVKVDTTSTKVKDTLELLAKQRLAAKTIAPKAPDNEFVNLLVKQQFSAAAESFDETMKSAFPAEMLEQTWNATASQMGAFKKQVGQRTEKQEDSDVVLVTCEFENGHLDIKLMYNDKKQIAGLFFALTPPEVVESYKQAPKLAAQEQPYIEISDAEKAGLIQVVEQLKAKLDYVAEADAALQEQFDDLQQRYEADMKANFEKDKMLLDEKDKYKQQIEDAQQDYKELEELLKKTTDEQVQTLSEQLREEKAKLKTTDQELLKTQAELKASEELMRRAQQELRAIKPAPDREVAAFKPDGKIILVDDQAKVVHLSIGSDDHAYRGLKFTVYDRNTSVTKDGEGKAEVEIFDIAKNYSAARIIRSEINRPILEDDVVANLIWDSSKINVFAIAGDFDLDDNGVIDFDAVDKIKVLIERWGGKVADEISIDVDFLILGKAPIVFIEPTNEEIEADPAATQKYNASLQRLNQYKEVQHKAEALWIPVFNYERFLYFIASKETGVF